MAEAEQLSEVEREFLLFVDEAGRARLTATDNAKLLGITRACWYTWINREAAPWDRRVGRIQRATRNLRADLAEKRLPCYTNQARRDRVAELVKILEQGDKLDR